MNKIESPYLLSSVLSICFLYFLGFSPSVTSFARNLDHGYQMALGTALLAGSIPGEDFFSIYGPLVGYFSALGLFLGGVAGEYVICSLGYAIAVTLAFRLAYKHGGIIAGILTVTLLLILIARFYKWYYWLLPLLALSFADAFALPARPRSASRLFCLCWGYCIGIALLFRIDLALHWIAMTAAACLIAFINGNAGFRNFLFLFKFSLLGFIAILAFTVATFALSSGNAFAFFDYYNVSIIGSKELLENYAFFPVLNVNNMLSRGNAHMLLMVCVPATYLCVLTFSICRVLHNKNDSFASALFLSSASGILIFPQALHMAEIGHFLQTIPPLIILISLLARCPYPFRCRISARAQSIFLASCLLFIGSATYNRDLEFQSWPFSNFRNILLLPSVDNDLENIQVADALRRVTSEKDRIFYVVDSTPTPIIPISGRAPAGIIPVYAPGLYKNPKIVARNVNSLRTIPPAVLVVSFRNWPPANPSMVPPYDPKLIAEWVNTYTVRIKRTDNFDILIRPRRINAAL